MFFKVYSSQVTEKDSFRKKIIRFTARYATNTLMPILYKSIDKPNNKQSDIIISLTSFPKRIDKTWIVIESILRQTLLPKKIVLTLSKKQFSSEDILPKELKDLKSNGYLEILWTEEDLRSHKKYLYTMTKYPNNIIITIDDDFIYEKTMIENLYKYHLLYPRYIITNLALEKKGDQYDDWENLLFSIKQPCFSIMQLGGSGVLYPPFSLHPDALNVDLIKDICPLADDIWLNAMAILNSSKIFKTDYKIYPMPLTIRANEELYKTNVLDKKNDEQIANLKRFYGSDILKY